MRWNHTAVSIECKKLSKRPVQNAHQVLGKGTHTPTPTPKTSPRGQILILLITFKVKGKQSIFRVRYIHLFVCVQTYYAQIYKQGGPCS